MGLVLYNFSIAIIAQSQGRTQEVYNASVAIVDEDRSALSRQIASALQPPYFQSPVLIAERDLLPLMNAGRYTFALDIPPGFERDARRGRSPSVQLDVDATAMIQAGIGSSYAAQILTGEAQRFLARSEPATTASASLDVRIAYNPNVESSWFTSVMGVLNGITMLSILLPGAAVIREREHGTMDHLLVMPIAPLQIALSKIWANGVVVLVAAGLSLVLVVRGALGVPIAGSIPLFLAGTALYLFFATAAGVYLATVARSMPQFGLLYLLVFLPLMILSGSNTPLESMPHWLSSVLQASPTVHFVAVAQAILYRGAGFGVVWRDYVVLALAGLLFLLLALMRFRKVAVATQS